MSGFATQKDLINNYPVYGVEDANGTLTTFPTLGDALYASNAPGTILVLGGVQPQALVVAMGSVIRGNGAVFGSKQVVVGSYPPSLNEQNVVLREFDVNSRITVIKQGDPADDSLIVLDGWVFNERAYMSLFALLTDTTAVTRVRLTNCRGINTTNASVGEVGAGGGSFVFQGRSDAGQVMELTIGHGCRFSSTVGSLFGGFANANSRVYLEGDAEVTPAPGFPLSNVVITPGNTPHTNLIVDNRSMVVRPPLAGETGYVWTATGAGTGNWMPK